MALSGLDQIDAISLLIEFPCSEIVKKTCSWVMFWLGLLWFFFWNLHRFALSSGLILQILLADKNKSQASSFTSYINFFFNVLCFMSQLCTLNPVLGLWFFQTLSMLNSILSCLWISTHYFSKYMSLLCFRMGFLGIDSSVMSSYIWIHLNLKYDALL